MRELKHGMWVVLLSAGKLKPTGILQLEFRDGTPQYDVHLVDDNGETSQIVQAVDLAHVRQAALDEIPEARRPGGEKAVSKKQAQILGYR